MQINLQDRLFSLSAIVHPLFSAALVDRRVGSLSRSMAASVEHVDSSLRQYLCVVRSSYFFVTIADLEWPASRTYRIPELVCILLEMRGISQTSRRKINLCFNMETDS